MFTYEGPWAEHATWLIQSLVILLLTLIVYGLEKRIYRHQMRKAEAQQKESLSKVVLQALHLPLVGFIFLLGISYAAQVVWIGLQAEASCVWLVLIRKFALLLLMTWFLLRLTHGCKAHCFNAKAQGKSSVDKTLVHGSTQLISVCIVIIAILIAMQLIGIPISGLLAFGGVGGLGVALAAKDLLANFFGGVTIYLDRPFKVGDWIRSPDKPIEGTVEYIGWRSTCIRTFDKRPMQVPNALFSTIAIENPSRMSNRRIRTQFGLRYEDAKVLASVTSAIEAMLAAHEDIDHRQTYFVKLVQFGASSLDILIYAFTKTTQWVKFQAIQQDVFLKILAIIEEHGAECAFPTQTLHLHDTDGEDKKI